MWGSLHNCFLGCLVFISAGFAGLLGVEVDGFPIAYAAVDGLAF